MIWDILIWYGTTIYDMGHTVNDMGHPVYDGTPNI